VQAVGLQFTLRQDENFSPSRHQTFYFILFYFILFLSARV